MIKLLECLGLREKAGLVTLFYKCCEGNLIVISQRDA
jgi:hypothetical protein